MNILKQTTRIAAIATVFTAFFAGALAIHAGETVVGTVPFEFTIGEKTYPAGEYKFEVDRFAPGTVRVRNTDRSTEVIALARKTDDVRDGGPVVTFKVYGAQRFLSTIETRVGTTVMLGPGRLERAAAKSQGTFSLASIPSSATRVAHN
jgi:hypothetical protein